jgi:hypothetical protein
MSTKMQDLANQMLLGVGEAPQTITASANGSAVDMISGDGLCSAIQQVGTVSGTSPTLAGKIQESADGSTNWTDVTNAAFTSVTTSSNNQIICFERTKRYLRYVATIGGTSPSYALAVIIAEQKKQL